VKLNLALQGGGAHGAFTWGVLDRLLEEEDITIGWVSGSSAGAVNAAALAAGLAEGSREAARAKLRQVWEAVHKAGVPDLLRLNPLLYGLAQSGPMAQMASLWSPYDFNPLGFDPLRTLLGSTIDFAKIRAEAPIELLIAATEVATGRARLFRKQELTVESVLASACLPTLHRTVEIDGVGYWDGGFSANPDLVTLASESPVQDTLLVQITPLVKQGLPTGAREIAGVVNRLTFNAPLLRDIEMIEMAREASRGRLRSRPGRLGALVSHRFHLVEAGRYTASLSDESKMKPDLGLLTYLHGAGRTQMHKWLGQNRAAIGKQASVDLKARFLSVSPLTPDDETGEEPADAQAHAGSGRDGKLAAPTS
jgi:NTE family protein